MTAVTYVVYVSLVIAITGLVARTLSKNGVLFLVDGFNGNEALARSVNHLLVVGFYLINVGFALVQIDERKVINTTETAILFLMQNIGPVLLAVGVMHMFNLYIIGQYRHGQINRLQKQKLIEKQHENPAA